MKRHIGKTLNGALKASCRRMWLPLPRPRADSKCGGGLGTEVLFKRKKGESNRGKAMPSEWEAGEVKDQRRHRYTDMDESLSWVNMTQKEIDAIWSELADDMENDVLKKDRVKKKLRCKYKERGKLIQSAYKKRKTRRNESEGNDCLGDFITAVPQGLSADCR